MLPLIPAQSVSLALALLGDFYLGALNCAVLNHTDKNTARLLRLYLKVCGDFRAEGVAFLVRKELDNLRLENFVLLLRLGGSRLALLVALGDFLDCFGGVGGHFLVDVRFYYLLEKLFLCHNKPLSCVGRNPNFIL